MQNETVVRDYLANVKEMINFVCGSPNQLAIFESLQAAQDGSSIHPVALRPFCPTRWCCRISSLKTILQNYEELILFFEEIELKKSDAGAKAKGFLKFLCSFDFIFVTTLFTQILEPVEILNAFLQNSFLQLQKAMDNIHSVREVLKLSRTDERFDAVWSSCLGLTKKFDVEEPKLPKVQKIPRRLDDGAQPFAFASPRDYYRKIYFEVLDIVINCFDDRFSKAAMTHFKEIETFLLSKTKDCSSVVEFYKDDFDPERLILHRNMMLDVCESKHFVVESTEDLVRFFSSNKHVDELIPEVVKLIKIALTIPVSTCTAERSFSALRKLKTYLRNTMTQGKLNDNAIMHVHKEEVKNKLNLETVANIFIKRSTVRKNTFFVSE